MRVSYLDKWMQICIVGLHLFRYAVIAFPVILSGRILSS